MATKRKAGKADSQAADTKRPSEAEKSFKIRIDGNTILTITFSIAAVPVGGKGPRPKTDELLLMLMGVLTAMLVGKTPKPRHEQSLVKALVGGKGRKRAGPSP